MTGKHYCFRLLTTAILIFIALFNISALADTGAEIANLQPGEWYEIPQSKLSEAGVFPDPLPPGNTGIASIMSAWCGGVYDTKRDRLLIWGGGHQDYSGNEIYAFDMNTFSWSRIWGPTPVEMIPTEVQAYQSYPDGSPSSRHTYSNIAYIPEPYDLFYNHGGSVWREPNLPIPYQTTWFFDLTKGSWSDTGEIPGDPSGKGSAVYDPVTKSVYARGKYGVYMYNVDTPQWTRVYRYGGGWWDFPSGDLDPNSRKIVYFGNCKVGVLNLSDLSYTHYTEDDFTGDTEIVCAREPGIAYDPIVKRFVVWSGDSSKSVAPQVVYLVNAETLTIEKRTPASSNSVIPTEAAKWGTYGRFRYIPSMNVFIVVNAINESVFVYRLSSSGNLAPAAPNNLHLP